jgi:hypothetical protein
MDHNMSEIRTYDLECLKNMFSYRDATLDGTRKNTFLLSPWCNQLPEMKAHVQGLSGQIGFKNLSYDYPLMEYAFTQLDYWLEWKLTNGQMLQLMYKKSQELIGGEKSKDHPGPYLVPQMDLYKMWHFDNRAKTQSLKGLQFHMHWPNVQDMPYSHDQILNEEEIYEILDYNGNDVDSTGAFAKKSADKIKLRMDLTNKYGIDMINMPDSTIGETIMLLAYCKKVNKSIEQVLNGPKTFRKKIDFADVVFNYVQFQTPLFQKLLNEIKSISLDAKQAQDLSFTGNTEISLKGVYEKQVLFKDIWFCYGLGGIHGSVEYKIFKSDGKKIIRDADVASLYPMLAIQNNVYPKHLGPVFVSVYGDDIVFPRLLAKKQGRKSDAEGLKIAANSVYGKSNSKWSWLYDPMFTLKITINGQLLLTMLAEQLVLRIPDIEIIQINTDGITVRMDRDKEELYNQICAQWMQLTRLDLEFVNYDEMIIRDVNNYIAIKEGCDRKTYEKDGMSFKDVKYKGAFEITKDFHKNTSFTIIPYALSEFFVAGRDIEQTIRNNKNVYIMMGRMKFKKNQQGTLLSINEDGELEEEELQKTCRYYVSNTGSPMVKTYKETKKKQSLQKRFLVTMANKIESDKIEDYDINYRYYIKECMDMKDAFYSSQLNMF